jgi:hypothetical protein
MVWLNHVVIPVCHRLYSASSPTTHCMHHNHSNHSWPSFIVLPIPCHALSYSPSFMPCLCPPHASSRFLTSFPILVTLSFPMQSQNTHSAPTSPSAKIDIETVLSGSQDSSLCCKVSSRYQGHKIFYSCFSQHTIIIGVNITKTTPLWRPRSPPTRTTRDALTASIPAHSRGSEGYQHL